MHWPCSKFLACFTANFQTIMCLRQDRSLLKPFAENYDFRSIACIYLTAGKFMVITVITPNVTSSKI